jgi:hypothetical protein
VARHYDRWEIEALPRVPGNAGGFGDFRGYWRDLGKFMNVKDDITGGNINIYEPYAAVALRPNYEIRIDNFYYHINLSASGQRNLSSPSLPRFFEYLG